MSSATSSLPPAWARAAPTRSRAGQRGARAAASGASAAVSSPVAQADATPSGAAPDPAVGGASADAATSGAGRARERLLAAATRLFAEKGYEGASTRAICQAADANVAAIAYHFGGKEGLWHEVLAGPVRELVARFGAYDDPALPLADALRPVLAAFLSPRDARAAQMQRLHLRQMIEPSTAYAQLVVQQARAHHDALARLLARHMGLAAPDREVSQLVFAIVAMAQDYCMSNTFMDQLAPELLHGEPADERVLERLLDWACALVAHERTRRAAASPASRRRGHPAGKGRRA